jgi:hypothetical protein
MSGWLLNGKGMLTPTIASGQWQQSHRFVPDVIEAGFMNKKVTLEIDVPPYMNGRTKVPVDINGIKGKIELFKLAL